MKAWKWRQVGAMWIASLGAVVFFIVVVMALRMVGSIIGIFTGDTQRDATYFYLFILGVGVFMGLGLTIYTLFLKVDPKDPLGIRDENG
jgi:hypothetical protein